jgi:hypothetical protein
MANFGLLYFEITEEKVANVMEKFKIMIHSVAYLFENKASEIEENITGSHVMKHRQYDSHACPWEECLESFAQIGKTWEFISYKDTEAESTLIKEGNELMMAFFLEVQRLQILSDSQLSQFLNKENDGQMILSYLIDRFAKPRKRYLHFFLNINLRQSLQ